MVIVSCIIARCHGFKSCYKLILLLLINNLTWLMYTSDNSSGVKEVSRGVYTLSRTPFRGRLVHTLVWICNQEWNQGGISLEVDT